MKKNAKYYLTCWIVLVALFNIICFVTPGEVNGISKYAGAFWSGYGFIMATFVAHLVYSIFVLSENSQEKKILNIPLMIISCGEVALMVICGMICITIPNLPNWIGIVLCSIVFAFSIIFVIFAKEIGDNALNANAKLNVSTYHFRNLFDTSQLLISSAKTEEIKEIARTVSEAVRYSDPISTEATRSLENEIETKLNGLLLLISNGEQVDVVKCKADELLRVVETRNSKCKTLKRQREWAGRKKDGSF